MVCKNLCMLLSLLLSYFIYSIIKTFGITVTFVPLNDSQCSLHPLPMPSEDLAVFRNFLIGATYDHNEVSFKHRSSHTMRPGYLISIDPKSMSVSKINTKNFPSEFQMNCHGIKVFNDKTLYVLSHGYKKGGERIFVFDLEIVEGEVEATYRDNYHFPGDDGIYNSIAFVDEKHFFITQWVPDPDEPEGRDNTQLGGLYRTFKSTYLKANSIKLCTIIGRNNPVCQVKRYGYLFNGIHYEDGHLFVSDSSEKSVHVYKVGKKFDLELLQRLELSILADNIWFDKGVGYVTGVVRPFDIVLLGNAVKDGTPYPKVPGGTEKFYFKDGKWVNEPVIKQDKLDFTTSAVVTDRIYSVSVSEPGILACPLVSK